MGEKAKSYNARYELLKQTQLEKITEQELSLPLRKKINDSFEHIYDEEKHITQEEREKWNKMDSLAAVQTQGLLFTAAEKKKLKNIEAMANNYIHPKYNSMDTNKSYIELTVNKDGHVVYANNPSSLDVDATESLLLDNKKTSFFLKKSDPVLEESPTVATISDTKNKNAQVNVQFMKNYCIDSSYYVSDSTTPVTNKIRIDSNSNMWYYNKDRGWVQLNKTSDIELDYDGKIKESYFRTKFTPYPIGVIIPSMSLNQNIFNSLEDLGFIQLDGSELKRSEYPELWNYINDANNGCYIVSDEDWNIYNEYSNSCGFFSTGDGKTTFRIPRLANVEPRSYNTTDDSLALGAVYQDAYPSEDANGFLPNKMQSFKQSSFYYPFLGDTLKNMYDSLNEQDPFEFNFVANTKTSFNEYKDGFSGVLQPGFPSNDTIFSIYANPYISPNHTIGDFSVIHEVETDQVDEDGEPIYKDVELTQDNQYDELFKKYKGDNYEFRYLNDKVYKQSTEEYFPSKLTIKSNSLDKNTFFSFIVNEFADSDVTYKYYIGQIKDITNKYNYNKYFMIYTKTNSTNYYKFYFDLKDLNTKYFPTTFNEDCSNVCIYFTDDASVMNDLTAKTDAFSILINLDDNYFTYLKNLIDQSIEKIGATNQTNTIFCLYFMYSDKNNPNNGKYLRIYTASLNSTKLNSFKTILDNFSKKYSSDLSTALKNYSLKVTLNKDTSISIDGFELNTYSPIETPTSLGFTKYSDGVLSICSNSDEAFKDLNYPEIVFKDSETKEIPKVPEVIHMDNKESGSEFSYNYLKTRFYIKAK